MLAGLAAGFEGQCQVSRAPLLDFQVVTHSRMFYRKEICLDLAEGRRWPPRRQQKAGRRRVGCITRWDFKVRHEPSASRGGDSGHVDGVRRLASCRS